MTSQELRGHLAELAAVRSDDDPILSLYLDIRWNDEQQRDRVRVWLQERTKAALAGRAEPEQASLARTLEQARELVQQTFERSAGEGKRGLALFACGRIGLWKPLFFHEPLENQFTVDRVPRLLQLARLAGELEPALVVLASVRGAHIYEVAANEVVGEITVAGPMPRRVGDASFGAGAGEQFERAEKNARHVDELLARFRRMAADELVHLFDRAPRSHVVLFGPQQALANFERELPERVCDRIAARYPAPAEGTNGNGGAGGRAELVARAAEAVAVAQARDEIARIDGAVGQALRGSLSVLGLEDVVLAVNERRVGRLLLEADFDADGWRCKQCGAMGVEHTRTCNFCEGPLELVPSLGDELVRRVLADDGEVQVVAHANKLHSYQGVAAQLRQASQTGLSGSPAQPNQPWAT
ncbi:baeRF10 domain-containing protein [Anaeromyxobacter paludicola]|uniref:Peptide chain release factor subunit 1 n=1 Tax=Anaeromyxobacter paludicola TaxID=2918171 RepID=A0ABM7XCQ3_9BACT|nr:hypothetical protein [Anaeromyxobacter paludicola]BDG09657.1 hypothetical protein AMPC_27700 [Anaeromyxobacter paludicola]